jgi:SAM-dependent methyltransferase
MMSVNKSYQADVVDYFRAKADAYDDVEQQPYWVFSDRLLWDVFQRDALCRLPRKFRFLDAGGGTGRWSIRVCKSYPESAGTLFDLSKDMSAVARFKARGAEVSDRLDIVNGALEEVQALLSGRKFELIFNFHNVLGFVQSPKWVLEQLVALLEPGGVLVSLVPNRYHATYFNIAAGRMSFAESAGFTGRGRFTEDMPEMHLFSPAMLRETYEECGLTVRALTGFPNFLYPGTRETALHGSTAALDELLRDASRVEKLLELERWGMQQPDIAGRGNNLLAVGVKER